METTEESVAAGLPAPGLAGRHAAARLLPPDGQSDALDRLTGLAARLLSSDSPVAVQVSLLTDVQTIAAGTGLPAEAVGARSALQDSLCTVTVSSRGPLVINTARDDQRVSGLIPVTSGAVGAYLGVPLAGTDGELIGALCAFDPSPRVWSAFDLKLLEELAGAVMAQLELQALSSEYRMSQLRWDVAVEAAGIGTFDWDLGSGQLAWDDQMLSLFGYDPGELEQPVDRAFERVHPDDRPALDAAIGTAIDSCSDFRADYRVVLPDGQCRWLSGRGRAVAGHDGTADRLVGTVHDVTQVRTARDEAAQLLESMASGFVAVDVDWRVRFVNVEASRVLGMSAEDVVGRDLWEAFPGLEETEFGREYKRAAAVGVVVELESYYPHLESWFEVRAVPTSDGLSLYFLDVTGRHADQQRAEAASDRLELLASVSAELAVAGLDVEGAVARLARLVVPVLGDWSIVSLVAENDSVRDVGCWHKDPAMKAVVETYTAERLKGRTNLGAVQEARETQYRVVVPSGVTQMVLPTLGSEQAKEALTALAPESVVVVPLIARGKMAGVLTLARGADRPTMSEEEIVTAGEVASRAALALDNGRLYAEQRGLAEGLQRGLLTTPPEPDHCQIAVRYVPAAEAASVGGDWFDSFLQADGATVLVIGDVMGHDTVAAAAMGQLRGLLRGIAWHSGAAPAEILSGLDAAMRGLQVDTTATAVVARLEQTLDERRRGVTRLNWSNAGHPPPMAINPDGSVLVLPGIDTNLLLGIDPDSARTESTVVLDRGSTVLLYTDGLIERRGQDLDQGLALLRDTLTEIGDLPLEELCDQLLVRMLPANAEDDVALVAVRLHRQDRPRPLEAGSESTPPNVPDEG